MAVIQRGEAVLAIRRGPRGPFAGHWSLPSGRIEPGESQAAAVAREVAEEVGLAVTPIAKVWECPTDDGAYLLHWWTARPAGASLELALDPHEVSAARWVTAAEFLLLEPGFAGDREFFARVLPGLTR
ncbi:MAG TPA: NUDIX domain-containing protein [Myxococcota bacterium]|nr:NUDIX domain-containing protein [Myxococcota bacterium]